VNSELEDLLLTLVRQPSVSGDEAAIAALCAEWLERAGLEVSVVERSVVARLSGGEGPRLLLNTHFDTVPAGEGWSADPWDVAWEGDRLVGLGANDAKASVASMMFAARALAQGPPIAGELLVAINHEEETTNAGMAAVLEQIGAPDLAVTGEPTGLEVVRAQAGLAVLTATWRGRSCHAAHVTRVEHENALLLAARDLATFPTPTPFSGEHPLLGPSTLTPTTLHSGERHNKVPDLAEAVFDARLAAPHDAEECLDVLRRHLPHAEPRVRSKRLAAVETSAQHPLVLAALRHTGRSRAIGSNTLSDMALLPGIPAVKCGPGQTARSHTPDEFVTRDELAAGAAFYTELSRELLLARSEETLS
jgi:acetylornithine deacetylase